MTYCGNQSSLFGASDKYIKFYNGNLIAVEGSNTVETQFLNFLRIPYSQVLRARITLEPGQVDYLLNYMGLGDNVTLLSISVKYDPKSKIEEDNYVEYAYYDDLSKIRTFCEILILSGNSTKRIPQLYLTNPNLDYPVILDVLVAKKGTEYNFFNDTINQSGTSFVNLLITSLMSHDVPDNPTVKIVDSSNNPLIYIIINNIQYIEKSDKIISINDSSKGDIFLKFVTQYDANQAYSLLNYIWENPTVDISSLNPLTDDIPPTIYFYPQVGNTSSGYYIQLDGATSSTGFNTSQGYTFSTTMDVSLYGTISSSTILSELVDNVTDNRDGSIYVTSSNVKIYDYSSTEVSYVTMSGTYSLDFSSIGDLAENYVDISFELIVV